ncbi:MAG: aromatic ring-hydroxylating dioxygenase subunit alpha, partial [Gammaproteobacteria bacterium]
MPAPKKTAARDKAAALELLAPWTYQNAELLGLEIERIFKRQWLLVCHVSELPATRDYFTLDAFGECALLLRGEDGQVRAFHNICRHRGAKLLDGRGRCPPMLSCPFHGWTYRLDGALASVPARGTFANLDPAQNGLAPLAMEIWMGFVFIRFAGDGAPLSETLRPAAQLAAHYQIEKMTPLAGARYAHELPYNWKTIHDIDNEGYHVPAGHPALQQLYGGNYRDDMLGGVPVSTAKLNDKPGKLWSVRHYQKLLPGFAHLPPAHQRLWLYVGVFPSMVLALYPDSIEFYMSIPLAPERSRVIGGAYALPDPRRETRAARYLNARINRITEREDRAFVRRLHQGLRSSARPAPRLSSLEQGVFDLHERIRGEMPVAGLAEAPAAGTLARVNRDMRAR